MKEGKRKKSTTMILTGDRIVQDIANRRRDTEKQNKRIQEADITRARMREFGSQSSPLLADALQDGAWKDERCFIIGGGPSLEYFKPSRLKGKGRVIAVNRKYETFPFADVMFSMDSRYYQWIKSGRLGKTAYNKFLSFKGIKVWMDTFGFPYKDDVHIVKGLVKNGVSRSIADGLTHGNNSGYAALQLALVLKANPIYLLGYDMNHKDIGHGRIRTHSHSGYPIAQELKTLQSFIRPFADIAEQVRQMGYKIFNCNSDSSLKCFPFCDINKTIK